MGVLEKPLEGSNSSFVVKPIFKQGEISIVENGKLVSKPFSRRLLYQTIDASHLSASDSYYTPYAKLFEFLKALKEEYEVLNAPVETPTWKSRWDSGTYFQIEKEDGRIVSIYFGINATSLKLTTFTIATQIYDENNQDEEHCLVNEIVASFERIQKQTLLQNYTYTPRAIDTVATRKQAKNPVIVYFSELWAEVLSLFPSKEETEDF